MRKFSGQKLLAARTAAGLSREKFRDTLPADGRPSVSAIAQHELDGVEPPLSTVVLYADALGLDVMDLTEDAKGAQNES